MQRALHPRHSVAQLYLPRKRGGRGLVSTEDCVDQATTGLPSYIAGSGERLLSVAQKGMNAPKGSCDEFKKRQREERIQEVTEKKLHGQFLREMRETASEKREQRLSTPKLTRHRSTGIHFADYAKRVMKLSTILRANVPNEYSLNTSDNTIMSQKQYTRISANRST